MRFAALALAALLAANAVYAIGLPHVLDRIDPMVKGGAYLGRASPAGSIGVHFVDVTRTAGIDVRRAAWGDDPPYPAIITGGVAAADVDGNGWTDLYFPPGGPGHPGHLYLNHGAWAFSEDAARRGLAHDGYGAGAGFGDFDNDGDPDLAVLVDADLRLYRNDGGNFTDVTAASGISSAALCGADPCQPASLAWTDADNDGRLDLFVVDNLDWHDPSLHTSGSNYGAFVQFGHAQRTVLWHNDGHGTFHDATFDANAYQVAKGLGVTAADLDGDGHPDLLTANDHTADAALRGTGDGTYRNVAQAWGLDEVSSSMGIQAGDVDGDGRTDLAVSNFRGEGLSLFVQQPSGAFAQQAVERGLGSTAKVTGWGIAVADFDLDGYLDIAHAAGRAAPLGPHDQDIHYALAPELREDTQDQVFRNDGHGRFVDATAASGFSDTNITRALLAVDLDNDGDLDVVRVNADGEPAQVLRNDVADHPGWIELQLHGVRSNADGFGAKVSATTPDGGVHEAELVSGGGYETGFPARLTLGLGPAKQAHIVVHWPSGALQDAGELGTGLHVLTEPAAPA